MPIDDYPASEAQIMRDVAVIRQSMREIDEGRGQDAGMFFNDLQLRLLAMKAADGSGLPPDSICDDPSRG